MLAKLWEMIGNEVEKRCIKFEQSDQLFSAEQINVKQSEQNL